MAPRFIKQTDAVTRMTLRGITGRAGQAVAVVLSIAIVVAVMIAFLSMADGFERTVNGAGSPDVAMVLRSNAGAELNSSVSLEAVKVLSDAPGIAHDGAGKPLVSPELYVIADGIKKDTGLSTNVPLRGMTPAGIALRGNVDIIAGRAFTPGLNELMVGRSAEAQYEGLALDSTVKLGPTTWKVVGIFSTGGSVFESEIWTDAKLVQEVFHRGSGYQIMRARLDGPGALEKLNAFIAGDVRLKELGAETETAYYAKQSKAIANVIRYLGYPLSIVMALGALAGALNSMYSSVAARGREIATLRAIGFGGFPTFVGTMVEPVILSLVGGFAGVAFAWLFFDGLSAATLGSSFTQVVFDLHVSSTLVTNGMMLAVIVGLAGGFFPAMRAARQPLVAAFRDE